LSEDLVQSQLNEAFKYALESPSRGLTTDGEENLERTNFPVVSKDRTQFKKSEDAIIPVPYSFRPVPSQGHLAYFRPQSSGFRPSTYFRPMTALRVK